MREELPLCERVNAAESVADDFQRPGIVCVMGEPKIGFEGGSRDSACHWLTALEQGKGEVAFIGRDL
jgi:hypothetical protein